jgi:phosphoribosylformylglycinamidine synthase PurS subunit
VWIRSCAKWFAENRRAVNSGKAERPWQHGCPPRIFSPGFAAALIIRRGPSAEGRMAMKAKIIITPKKAVVDPQGKTVQSALAHLGYTGVSAVHVGKYIEIELALGADPATAQRTLDEACHKFLSNPIIEDYKLEIE